MILEPYLTSFRFCDRHLPLSIALNLFAYHGWTVIRTYERLVYCAIEVDCKLSVTVLCISESVSSIDG